MPNSLWTAHDIAQAVGGHANGDWIASGISIDSRSIENGDLFIALHVDRDGHQFVNGALRAGASGALVSDMKLVEASSPIVKCKDTMLALENLATAARRRAILAKRIAITGSVGKTTVKELTASALAASGKTHKSVKSYNNHWGVPLTLARMPQDARFGVFEIGMNHAGEISRLSPQIRPHIAAITTIAPVHIEHFHKVEAIADAKAEIFLGIERGGTALLPADNEQYERLVARARDIDGISIQSFGQSQTADARIVKVENHDNHRMVQANVFGELVEWKINEPGNHWLNNGLCALAIVALAGGEIEAAASVLSNFAALDGRGSVKSIALPSGEHFTLVDEAYNANPTSVAGALDALSKRSGKRRIAVLGDMLELGERENEYHAGLKESVLASKVDLVFLSGPRMKYLWDELPANIKGSYATNSRALAHDVCAAIHDDDVIMVKGSNGSHMNVIVAALGALKHQTNSEER
ncbi:MAG: UDP-N-acetylmuramoyl-tripeptide--D-alanyl-D-alanine ligase [Pseudomonadota bacterium]